MKAALSAVAMIAILFDAYGGPVHAQDEIKAVYEAAKKERKVVYWGSPDVRTAKALTDAFMKTYPGIEVEIFKIQPAPAIERIITATNAGRADVDVIDSQLGYMELLLDRGLLEPYPWHEKLGIERDRLLYDNRAVIAWHLDTPLAFNTDLVKPGEIKSWDDALAPKYNGKVIVEARGFMFAVLALAWGEEKAFDYLKKLMANRPVITKGGTNTIEALAGGQGALAFGAYGGILQRLTDQGAPVDWVRLGPIATQVAVLLPLKNAPHPNAVKLWTKFYTSSEAQEIIYKNQGLDVVIGRDIGPIGKRYKEAGLDIVPESTDAAKMRRLVAEAGKIIGALK